MSQGRAHTGKKSKLCSTFRSCADRTWKLLATANKSEISLSETTLTELNILEIQSRHPTEVIAHQFTQREEGTETGADWEWWWGGGGQWLGVRVQAKKLDSKTLRYKELSAPRTRKQIDDLIRNALKNGCSSLYCFYNYWELKSIGLWNCCELPRRRSLLGCSIANAYDVRGLVSQGNYSLSSMAEIMHPWSCMICCKKVRSTGRRDTLPKRVARFLRSIAGQHQGEIRIQDLPPRYVSDLLERRQTQLSPEGVSGVIVIQQSVGT